MRNIFVCDLSLAAILAAKGVPIRKTDPVTRESRLRDGKWIEQARWWFDVEEGEMLEMAETTMTAYHKAKDWAEYTLDKEDPVYWMKGALENRVALLHLFHHGATPMKIIEDGGRTIIIGPRLSEANKKTLKALL